MNGSDLSIEIDSELENEEGETANERKEEEKG
jgi:hypothetical protein